MRIECSQSTLMSVNESKADRPPSRAVAALTALRFRPEEGRDLVPPTAGEVGEKRGCCRLSYFLADARDACESQCAKLGGSSVADLIVGSVCSALRR